MNDGNAFIRTSGGHEILIDSDMFDVLNRHKWQVDRHTGYAKRTVTRRKTGSYVEYMHRVVNETPDGLVTDHINQNKLDNRRCNLRSVTVSENGMNTKLPSDNTSGVKNISFDRFRNKWTLHIRDKNIGRFNTLQEAIIKKQEVLYV